MKKKLALVLAAAMALTSLPTVAFGKSSNSISTVISAKEDTKLIREGAGPTAPEYIPRVEIVNDNKVPITYGSTIRISLTNAEWLDETNTSSPDYAAERLIMPSDIEYHATNNSPTDVVTAIRKIDSRTVEFVLGQGSTTTPVITPTPYDAPTVAEDSSGDQDLGLSASAITPTNVTVTNFTDDGSGNVAFALQNASTTTVAYPTAAIATIATGVTESGTTAPSVGDSGHSVGDKFAVTVTPASSTLFTPSYNSTSGNIDITAGTYLTGMTLDADNHVVDSSGNVIADYFDVAGETITIAWDEVTALDGSNDVQTVTSKSATFTIFPYSARQFDVVTNVTTGGGVFSNDAVVKIPMLVELTGIGDAIATIETNSGTISTGPLTFATVSQGDVKVTVSSTVSIPETGKELEDIVVNEVTPGSLQGEYYLRLKAPSNFYWDLGDKPEVRFAGGLSGQGTETLYGGTGAIGSPVTGYNKGAIEGLGDKKNNEITVFISASTAGLPKTTNIGTVILSGLVLKPTDDAKFGDVNVSVRGAKVSSTSVLVGEYKDYVVTMEPEDKDLPVILAGYFPGYADNNDATNEEEVRALEVHISESVPNSWWGLRKTTLSVPDGVQIRGAEIKFAKGASYEELIDEYEDKVDISTISSKGKFTEGEVTIYNGERLEFKGLKMKDDEKAEVWVRLYLSVEPGFTGDIEATLAGGGIEDDITATIATAVNPVNVSMKQTEIKLGYKNIELNDITITENKAGAIRKNYYGLTGSGSNYTASTTKSTAKMILQIGDTTDNQYLKFDSIGSYEITEGDLTLDSVKVRSGNIEMEVKSESSKPSTIVLKNVTGLADRVPPEGYYALSIGGKAVVNNYYDSVDINGYFETEFFEVPKAYNVITAAPGSANEFNTYVQMKIDDTTMIVGSDTIQMDAAPYISEGRTMLPIRYVANAFGISDDNIHFDQNSKTVTLVTQNRTVQLTVGSRTILSNGTPIEMDVAAEITDGRTFIPVMWVATALGISQPVWDEATRTVTFNGEYASNDALGSQVQDNSGADAEVVSTDDADKDEE